jgi:hypothetical protein
MIDEQTERIKENVSNKLENILDAGDVEAFWDLFEDRDPFEFL